MSEVFYITCYVTRYIVWMLRRLIIQLLRTMELWSTNLCSCSASRGAMDQSVDRNVTFLESYNLVAEAGRFSCDVSSTMEDRSYPAFRPLVCRRIIYFIFVLE
jgi:hypothetical protein